MAGDVTLAAVLAFSGAARRICRALGDPLARLIDFRGDPYPFYEAIRDRGTLVHSRLGPYLTASHELCSAVLRDARFGVIPSSELPPVDLGLSGDGPHRIVDPVDESFLKLDPPEHTRLRRMVSSSFTPHALRSRSEAITAIVTEFLDRVDGRGGFDLMRDFAARVP
ncbi:MAG: cytochrome P450, partial [Kutzneria sp.]|nr:cytochrome P450 [Kutzneria sp.]